MYTVELASARISSVLPDHTIVIVVPHHLVLYLVPPILTLGIPS